MFISTKTIKSSKDILKYYIEGVDLYNSLFLYKLLDPTLEKEAYEIKVSFRPDLIARDFYGSEEYQNIIILQLGSTLSEYTKGRIVKLIPKSKLPLYGY